MTSELAIAWARLPERARPNHWAAAARRRPRLRPLPADDRPGDRGATAGGVPCPPAPPCALPVVCQSEICRVLEAARALRLAAARCHARGAVRAARQPPACASARPSASKAMTSTWTSGHHDPGGEVRPVSAGAAAPDRHRGACVATPPSATGCARSPARRRSSCPPPAPGSIAAASTRRSARSPTAIGIRTATVRPRVTRPQA